MVAILGLLWLIGEPHLKNYIAEAIIQYDNKKKEEASSKVPLRALLSHKMEVADDEVHIELGKTYRTYKKEKNVIARIDSLCSVIKYLESEIQLNLDAIKLNYKDINQLNKESDNFRKQLDKHGLFH